MIDLTLGFIGTGGIASAMVRGFCASPDFSGRINLTVHKNRDKADALKKLFPDRISVHESNQAVADGSDVVFICVLPQQHEEVVRGLAPELAAEVAAREARIVRQRIRSSGFPYVKAFLPQEAWRDREQRFSQPCELRFAVPAEEGAAPAVTLVAITETWRENSLKPDLSATDIPVSSVDAFPALLQKHSPPDIGVLLVFVPGSLPYAAVRPWLDAVRDTHSLVQIFVD